MHACSVLWLPFPPKLSYLPPTLSILNLSFSQIHSLTRTFSKTLKWDHLLDDLVGLPVGTQQKAMTSPFPESSHREYLSIGGYGPKSIL